MEDKFIVLKHSFIRDASLTMQEKIIYLEILNLSSLDKGCIASNSHFEKCFGISKKSVSNTIASLVSKGYITSIITDRNHTRILSIKDGQVSIKDGQVSIKDGESKENKTVNKTINKDATLLSVFFEENKPNEYDMGIAKWFVYYRRRIKKPVSTTAPIKMALKQINICMNEGYTLDEIKEAMESREWQSLKLEWIQKEIVKEKEW